MGEAGDFRQFIAASISFDGPVTINKALCPFGDFFWFRRPSCNVALSKLNIESSFSKGSFMEKVFSSGDVFVDGCGIDSSGYYGQRVDDSVLGGKGKR